MSDNLKIELSKFGRAVVQQSRSRLTKGKKNASKDLYNSLKFDVQEQGGDLTITFFMEEYGKFVDKGVNGIDENNGAPFSYKKSGKKPPANVFEKWSRTRGIRGRDKKTGKFITRKSLAFAIREHVYKNGIKPTLFFTKSFEQQFKRLSDDLGDAFSGDIDNLLDI